MQYGAQHPLLKNVIKEYRKIESVGSVGRKLKAFYLSALSLMRLLSTC